MFKNTPSGEIVSYYKSSEELALDADKKSKQYYKDELYKIGIDLKLLEKDTGNKMIKFLQEYKDEKTKYKKVLDNLQKQEAYNLEKIKMMEKLEKKFKEKNQEVFCEANDEIKEMMIKQQIIINLIDGINLGNKKELKDLIASGSSIAIDLKEMEKCYNRLIAELLRVYYKTLKQASNDFQRISYNEILIQCLFNVLIYSFKDVYFSSITKKSDREIIFKKSNSKLLDFYNKEIIEQKNKEILSENYDIILYSFLTVGNIVDNIAISNGKIEIEEILCEEFLNEEIVDNLEESFDFADIKKKDRLFMEKKLEIEKLVKILAKENSGLELDNSKIIKKVLYQILDNSKFTDKKLFKKNKKLFKIVKEIIAYDEKKDRKCFTVINGSELDSEDREFLVNINIINRVIKREMNVALGKNEENNYLDILVNITIKILKGIQKEMSPELINEKLIKFLEIEFELIKEIDNYLFS